MGVQGLSTYLREHRRHLAHTYEITRSQSSTSRPVVVDGWSFIYNVQQNSALPWVYGGEFPALIQLACEVLRHWLAFGLEVHIVFDGAYPELKFATLKSRATEQIQSSLLFCRTSPVSRSTPRFLRETQIMPPLSYSAYVHALEELSQRESRLKVYYADEEGDPYAVELAGRIGGCVVGMDSDFVVLNTEGYKGYIPLDEMIWVSSQVGSPSSDNADDDFKPVTSRKKGKVVEQIQSGRGIIPPLGGDLSTLTLSFTVYKPSALAERLKVPISLLPLLGAILGNDYSKQTMSSARNIQSMFFSRQMTFTQRIDNAAATLQSILSTSQRKKLAIGSVMDLIDKTVRELLARSIHLMGTGEVDHVVEKVVEATLQYAIPHRADNNLPLPDEIPLCVLHTEDTCPILPLFSRLLGAEESEGDEQRVLIRNLYISAYRRGHLHPRIMDTLHTGTYWARMFLENPDIPSCSRTIGRPIRLWAYSIIDNAVGLPRHVDAVEEEPSKNVEEGQGSDSDEDELIDVAEEDSDDSEDPLAPLRGALQRLHTDDDSTAASDAPSGSSSYVPKVVIEHVRRGVRLADEAISVPELRQLLSSVGLTDIEPMPLVLQSEEQRLAVFLRVLGSDTPIMKTLEKDHLMAVLVVRMVVRSASEASDDKGKERWTQKEAMAFLTSFASDPASVEPSDHQALPQVTDRNLHLTAQVVSAVECIEELSQSLLLTDRIPSPVHRFSGQMCYRRLTEGDIDGNEQLSKLWEACRDSLGEVFRNEWKSVEKKKKHANKQAKTATKKGEQSGRGLFDVLGDAEI